MTKPLTTFLITGAANGLGQALSKKLINASTQLILLDNDLNALNALYDELDAAHPNQVYLYPLDLKGANPDDYAQLAETLKSQFGKLDGLFLNAAINPAFTPIEFFDIPQWYEVMQVNLNANFHLIQNCLPLLKQSDNGKLVGISDQDIHQHPAYYGAYGVAKAGLEQLLKTVSAENAQSSLTTYIAQLKPFQSSLRAHLFPGEDTTQLPLPEEVAQKIVTLVTEGLNDELIYQL
jgi:NAD(P)-dependent dehydrogenase (short-subunit alcohol dehydrogenase family)